MRFPVRTAALAAAVVGLCTAGATAAPSIASEREGTPSVSYMAHAAAEAVPATSLTADNLGLNDLTDPAPAPEVTESATAETPAPVTEPAPERRSLSELVAEHAGSTAPDAETDCLARGVYYESKGEPLSGQLSVAEVIINRARSGRFAPTICGVLRQRGQFSFVRGGVIPTPPAASRDWRTAVAIARIAMEDLADGAAPRALFFHARRVNPGWRLTRVATVGNHVFYR